MDLKKILGVCLAVLLVAGFSVQADAAVATPTGVTIRVSKVDSAAWAAIDDSIIVEVFNDKGLGQRLHQVVVGIFDEDDTVTTINANSDVAAVVATNFANALTSSLVSSLSAPTDSTGGVLRFRFGFKVAAVPFHMWTPDVYQGAPTAVTAFMSSGAKIAGFAALLRVFATAFPSLATDMTDILWALAALTMIVGNIVAISQTDIKRLLAYSSIAHAGYILMAFVPYGNPVQEIASTAIAAGLFYLVAYAVTNFGAWGIVIALEKKEGKGLAIEDYAGLGKKNPALAAAMTVFILSFIGFPPTLGMVGKFYLFRSVIDGGFIWLAIIGVLTSLVSAFYYLRVVVTMYMKDGDPETERETWLGLTTGGMALATVIVSLVPQFLFSWASEAVLKLF
jgi:proton-translocating NADH-quinone oxidoreductase chain N